MEEHNFLKNILDSVHVGGLLVDSDRTIRECNAVINRIFGYSEDEVVGKKTELLYGDRRINKLDKNEIYDRLARSGYHIGNAEGTTKDGRQIPLELYTFVVKENAGAIILISETGRPPAAPSIDTAKLLQDLLDNIPDMIYVKDSRNRFIMVNRAHASALGLAPEEVVGKSDLDFFPGELAEKYFADDNEILKTGKPILDKIEAAPRPDGSITYVSTTKVPRFDAGGKVIGTIGITRNVTERVTAEEEVRRYKEHLEELVRKRTRELEENQEKLLRMYNLKSDFTSMVSHELRTPLAVIKESVGIVGDGTSGALNEKQKNFLDMASNNIERLSRLINDVLDLSKLEKKKIEFKMIEGNLNEVIDHVVTSYEPLLKKKGLRLHKAFDPFLPLVRFDPDRISQVLYNLITNAIKFTENGRIKIWSGRNDGGVTVTVEDSGEGIRKEDLYRIFEKFEQIPSENGAKKAGTGLGLAICKQIIEQLGGRIWAESEYGRGSKFSFSLPVK